MLLVEIQFGRQEDFNFVFVFRKGLFEISNPLQNYLHYNLALYKGIVQFFCLGGGFSNIMIDTFPVKLETVTTSLVVFA